MLTLLRRAPLRVLLVVLLASGCVRSVDPETSKAPESEPEPRLPTVVVTAVYPNANALQLRDAVAEPIEKEIHNVEKVRHFSSRCTNDGDYTLTITFEPDVDLDQSEEEIRRHVEAVQSRLPKAVRDEGILVNKVADAPIAPP
jgi:multidrug efflux pump